MDMNLSKVQELVMDRKAQHATVHAAAKSWTRLSDWTELKEIRKWDKTLLWLIPFYHIWWCSFHRVELNLILIKFCSAWKISFIISCNAGQVAINYISCCLSGRMFISSLFLLLFFFTYNQHTAWCKFKVYSILIRLTYFRKWLSQYLMNIHHLI